MDVMDGQTFFAENFEFYPTPPLNDNFEFFLMGDMNFMNQSASYFLIQVSMLFTALGK